MTDLLDVIDEISDLQRVGVACANVEDRTGYDYHTCYGNIVHLIDHLAKVSAYYYLLTLPPKIRPEFPEKDPRFEDIARAFRTSNFRERFPWDD